MDVHSTCGRSKGAAAGVAPRGTIINKYSFFIIVPLGCTNIQMHKCRMMMVQRRSYSMALWDKQPADASCRADDQSHGGCV